MNIVFEPLNESHFPLLLKWLESPHVKKWWDSEITYTMDLVKEKYGACILSPATRGSTGSPQSQSLLRDDEGVHCFIIRLEQTPIGYIQIYNAYDFPHTPPLSGLPTNLGAFDIFIGEKEYLNKGLGSKAITEFLRLYASNYSYIFADPDSRNIAAIKCYEKAGFKRIAGEKSAGEVWMIWKKEANWDLYYTFEEVVYKAGDDKIKKILDQFDIYDFLELPIIFDLVSYKKLRLLKLLRKKGIPLTYEEPYDGGNALHVSCAAGGDLEYVKFFVENDILTDINKKSLRHGDTPLNLAISYEHKDILEYFKRKFGVNSILFDDLDVVLDRLKSNYRKIAMRKAFFTNKK